MKKSIFLSIFAAIFMTACNNAEEPTTPGNTTGGNISKWSLSAGNTATRATVGDAESGVRPVKWEAGDKLTVFNASASADFGLDSGSGSTNGSFSGESNDITDGVSYYAAYADNAVYSASTGLTVSMPSPFTVDGTMDAFVGDNIVMLSDAFSFTDKGTSDWVRLDVQTAVLDVPVKIQGAAEAAVSVKMTAPVADYFVTTAVYDGAGGVDYTTAGEIVINFATPVDLNAATATAVKFVVWMNPAVEQSALDGKEFTFTFSDADNGQIAAITKKAVLLEGGKYYNAPLMGSVLAEEKSISYIKTLAAGAITDDIYISGRVVADGSADNFTAGTYSIQDDENNAILFTVEGSVPFARYDDVKVLLSGAAIAEVTEGTFTYKMLTGISNAAILNRTADDGTFAPEEMTIADLTADMLHATVTLKDVEVASPHGAYTNFKKTHAVNSWTNDYMKLYPAYYRFYPTCIRDIAGNNMYMLTNPEASFAVTTLPQGGGKITGMVVREVLTNFNITESQLSIRPLELTDVDLEASRADTFTALLVEWDCNIPNTGLNTDFTNNPTHVAPSFGDASTVLSRTNVIGFSNPRKDPHNNQQIYSGAEFRGDASNSDGRINGPIYNSLSWHIAGTYWYIDKVSTVGIDGLLSLQLEANGSHDSGVVEFKVQYAIAEAWNTAGISWIDVPGGVYKVLPQFGQGTSELKKPDNIVGFKVYDFKLPSALNNKANICLRLIPTGTARGGSRLANLSIKYNKEGSSSAQGMMKTGGLSDLELNW